MYRNKQVCILCFAKIYFLGRALINIIFPGKYNIDVAITVKRFYLFNYGKGKVFFCGSTIKAYGTKIFTTMPGINNHGYFFTIINWYGIAFKCFGFYCECCK